MNSSVLVSSAGIFLFSSVAFGRAVLELPALTECGV